MFDWKQRQQEVKQFQKVVHAMMPTFGRKTQKTNEVRSLSRDQKIQSLQYDEYGIAHQSSIKHSGRGKKLTKKNEKLTENNQHVLHDTLDLRMANKEREIDAILNYQLEQFSQTNSQMERSKLRILRLKTFYRFRRRRFNQNRTKKWILKRRLKKQRKKKNMLKFRKYVIIAKENIIYGIIVQNFVKSRENHERNKLNNKKREGKIISDVQKMKHTG